MPKEKKTADKFVLASPAKLNLALQITGRRADGFHTLNTIFERISLADQISFSSVRDTEITLSCNHPAIPLDERNLVYKAALFLRQETGVIKGARVAIRKNIPVAAGLAGGSSNAAAALLGLNRLWQLNLSRQTLIRLARKIGSDVAFFLYDIPWGLGTDRGDKIRKLQIKERYWHVLITAKEPLLTKDVYGVYADQFLSVNKPFLAQKSKRVKDLAGALKRGDVGKAQELLFNDLSGPIGVIRPALLKLKARVEKSALKGVCFSGSGPSIFALTASRAQAQKIAKEFKKSYDQVFVVETH